MGGHHRGIPNPPEQLVRRIEEGRQIMLADQAMLAGWGTPQGRDHKDTGNQTNVPVNDYLPRQVMLVDRYWQAGQPRKQRNLLQRPRDHHGLQRAGQPNTWAGRCLERFRMGLVCRRALSAL